MTFCMTLKTMIMVTRTKLLFVADNHANACTYSIYNEHKLYMQNPIVMIFTVKFYSYKQYTNLKVCSCILAYVYSQ